MRRIKMIVGKAAVLVGMLALNAGPAMAGDLDGFFTDEDFSGDTFSLWMRGRGWTNCAARVCPMVSSSPDVSSATPSKRMTPTAQGGSRAGVIDYAPVGAAKHQYLHKLLEDHSVGHPASVATQRVIYFSSGK